MVASVVVMLDEGFDLAFKIARKEVVLQQDAVLERLVPAFNLALGLRVERCAADMAHRHEFGAGVEALWSPLAHRSPRACHDQ